MASITVQAEIDLDDEQLDGRVINAAAAQLLNQISLTSRYGGTVSDIITSKLEEIVAGRVEELLDKEISQVDRYGDLIKGPNKTFREVFAERAEAFLTERVDSTGRVSTEFHFSKPRLERLLGEASLHNMEAECRKVATEFKAQLQERAKAALSKVVAEHIKI